MKKLFRFNVLLAMIITFAMTGCSKDDSEKSGSGKLSPPAWAIGTWGLAHENYEFVKITDKDVIIEKTTKLSNPAFKAKEIRKTDPYYDIQITDGTGKKVNFMFLQGDDDSYIGFSTDLEGFETGGYAKLDRL